jgi:hypothetical protein
MKYICEEWITSAPGPGASIWIWYARHTARRLGNDPVRKCHARI